MWLVAQEGRLGSENVRTDGLVKNSVLETGQGRTTISVLGRSIDQFHTQFPISETLWLIAELDA